MLPLLFRQQKSSHFVKKAVDKIHICYYSPYQMRTKRAHEKAVRTTVSMPPHLHELAEQRVKNNSYSAFSDYIQELIRRDNAPRVERRMTHATA